MRSSPVIFSVFLALLFCSCSPKKIDLLIRDGLVFDGAGTSPYRADLGIDGDSILFLGDSRRAGIRARREIDAAGYIVAPGFIDPHTHLDPDLFHEERKSLLSHLYQGVTTAIVGNDGFGLIGTSGVLHRIDSSGVGINIGVLVGHNRVRRAVMGVSPEAPSPEELEQMKELVARGMEGGALGLSAGLFYTPGNFSQTEEVIELARIAARYGGIYDVHMRDESSYSVGLLAAVKETIRIAEEAEIHANIAHIKALGADVWGKSSEVVALVEEAQKRGVSIGADQYPYRASSTGLGAALLPQWVFADDPDPRKKLNDPELLPRIREGMTENLRIRGGAEAILLSIPEEMEEVQGKTLKEVADTWETDPVGAALRILRNGGSRIISFNMQETDIHRFMQRPWVMTSSDGGAGHPRKYGSFPKKIREFVIQKKVISLEEMIHRSTLLTAETFGIPRRGRLAPGYLADILVFRPSDLNDAASFDQPFEFSTGMYYVVVNGRIAVEKGKYTGVLAGKAVRR